MDIFLFVRYDLEKCSHPPSTPESPRKMKPEKKTCRQSNFKFLPGINNMFIQCLYISAKVIG